MTTKLPCRIAIITAAAFGGPVVLASAMIQIFSI